MTITNEEKTIEVTKNLHEFYYRKLLITINDIINNINIVSSLSSLYNH